MKKEMKSVNEYMKSNLAEMKADSAVNLAEMEKKMITCRCEERNKYEDAANLDLMKIDAKKIIEEKLTSVEDRIQYVQNKFEEKIGELDEKITNVAIDMSIQIEKRI